MKREFLIFLIAGFAFGTLFGYGVFKVAEQRPVDAAAGAGSIPAPAGPAAPTQVAAGGGGAPMMQEINDLKRRLQDKPDDVDALLRLGDVYRSVGMWDQADTYFERALETDPDDPRLPRVLANVNHDSGRFDKAIELYQKALALAPDEPDLLTDMGICYKEIGQYDRALELFSKANRIAPEHWQSLFNTVVVQGFDLGQVGEAEQAMQRLEQMRPDAPEVQRLRQALARRASEPAEGSGS